MKVSKKICIICGNEDYIFSKKRCKSCAMKTYSGLTPSPLKASTYKLSTKRHTDKNKALREGLGDFFISQVRKIREENISCENCGTRLSGNIGEVAHILSKNKHPLAMKEPQNVVYLCFSFTNNTKYCHESFDKSMTSRVSMPVFEVAKKRFLKFYEESFGTSAETAIFAEQ